MSLEQNQANAEVKENANIEDAQTVQPTENQELEANTAEQVAVEAAEQPSSEPQQSLEAELNAQQLTEKLSEVEKALARAQKTVDDQKDSVVRAKAEVENMRRRTSQDVEKAHKFALEKFATALLPIVDNLERAIQFADKENEATKGIVEGVELTHQSFIDTMNKFNLQVVDPQGEAFNPELHQAMSMVENAELKPNTITGVMQKGYVLNGRLLRPAMVMVSKAPSESIDTTV